MNWTGVLDTLERQLHRQEVAFRGTAAMPDGLRLERPDSAMTESEQIRAIDLMQRHDLLITETLAVMKRTRRTTSTPYSS